MPQANERSDLLAAIHRRLWRDLGFAEPVPAILPLLPSLLVGWADGTMSDRERARIETHANSLPKDARGWLAERLDRPPGPYFRYQVLHLLTFMVTAWRTTDAEGHEWANEGEAWATEILREQGWIRRILGQASAEREELAALHDALHDHDIFACDRIWALARGAHAEGEPREASLFLEDGHHAEAILLACREETLAVGCYVGTSAAEPLDTERLAEICEDTRHLHEIERWAAIAQLVEESRSRPGTRQVEQLRVGIEAAAGCAVEEVDATELGYLEDALAVDARWMRWRRGDQLELQVTRERVTRLTGVGRFEAARSDVEAEVLQQVIPGPPGLAFRVLEIVGEGKMLRLAGPILTEEPPPPAALAWMSRVLPSLVAGPRDLLLDASGKESIATRGSADLPEGQHLLVPPWIWFRVANALGKRYFSGRRRPRTTPST